MTTVSFADLPGLIRKYQHRVDAVVKQATHDVAKVAQTPVAKGGRMPVDTGFLRNSFTAQLMGGAAMSGPDAYTMIAGAMKAGDVATFGWTAEYARAVEYGANGRPGRHFVAGAVDQWQAIVRDVVARAVKEIG